MLHTGDYIIYYLLVGLGYFFAHLPRCFIRGICVVCGTIAMFVLPKRKRQVLSNLYRAFPNHSAVWHRKICRENFYRLIELGLLGISSGFFNEKQIKKNFKINWQHRKILKEITESGSGAIILIPHLTCLEAITLLPGIVHDLKLPDIGVIYRPFSNRSLEKFIKRTREKPNMRLLSRKNGFLEAMKILREKGILTFLFDQNAGESGCLTSFFGKTVSSTDLPCILYKKFKAPVYFLYPRRKGVWRATFIIKKLTFDESDEKNIIFAANKYLEDILKRSDNACADWLWAHDRWKISLSCLESDSKPKHDWTQDSRKYLKINTMPQDIRVFVRMPNWLGDVVMAVPVIRMLRASQKNLHISLLCQKQFAAFLRAINIADEVIELPSRNIFYFFKFNKIKYLYPDVYISLVNSMRGDIETLLSGATKTIGIEIRKNPIRKFFIKNLYPGYIKFGLAHQTKLWQEMLHKFGFGASKNFSTFRHCLDTAKMKQYRHSIGIFCGSLNNTRKRWPEESWKIIIERIFERYEGIHLNLYGTIVDNRLISDIAASFARASIANYAGRTTLLELIHLIQQDELIIAIDSGGMHLANMFGCPLVCIYGVTNPISAGPIFDAKKVIVRPHGCPESGGFPIEDVKPEDVFAAVKTFLG